VPAAGAVRPGTDREPRDAVTSPRDWKVAAGPGRPKRTRRRARPHRTWRSGARVVAV